MIFCKNDVVFDNYNIEINLTKISCWYYIYNGTIENCKIFKTPRFNTDSTIPIESFINMAIAVSEQ